MVFSGANSDSSGNQPTCSDKNNSDVAFGSGTTITFTDGVGVCVLKLYREETASIDAAIGSLSTSGGAFYDLDVVVSKQEISSGGASGADIKSGAFFVVNDGSSIVSSRYVTLHMKPSSDVKSMAVSNDENFIGVSVEKYREKIDWILTGADGLNKVYVKFWYEDGLTSGVLSTSVILDTRPSIIYPVEGQEIFETPFVVEGTADINARIEITIAGTVYSVWSDDEGKFSVDVLDQLTKGEYEIGAVQVSDGGYKSQNFARKIKFGEEANFKEKILELGIEGEDFSEIIVPEQAGESYTTETTVDIVSPEVIIGSPTSDEVQEELKIVEKKEAFLLVMKKGSVGYYKEQTNGIETVGGESVEILLRPKKEVHSIVGRLYSVSTGEEKVSLLQKVKNWFTGTVYAEGVMDKKELVDAYVFEYDDTYNIYRVGVTPPDDNGHEYELLISMNNKDGSRVDLKKNIKTVFKGAIKSGNTDVSYARIEIFRQNKETGKYEAWNAELYGSKNPIFTDEGGKYAMQLPPGAYYLEVAAPGYEVYQSKIYLLLEPMVVNDEINMTRGSYSGWFRFWEWVKRNTK